MLSYVIIVTESDEDYVDAWDEFVSTDFKYTPEEWEKIRKEIREEEAQLGILEA